MKYFIIKDDAQQGPYSIYELKDQGITSDTFVWAEGMTDWTPAWQVEELKNFLFNTKDTATPPPYDPSKQQPAQPSQAVETPQPAPKKEKKKSGCGGCAWIIIGLLVALLIAMAVTCPDKETHKRTIQEKISLALDKTISENAGLAGVFEQGINIIRSMFEGPLVGAILDEALTYHNYYVFSKTTIQLDGKDEAVSYGVLGKVFTVNEDDIAEYLKKNKSMIPDLPALTPGPNIDDDEEADTDTDNDETALNAAPDSTKDSQLMDEIQDEIINTVGTIVKKQINARTDSATGNGWNKIVEGIIDVIKTNK